MSTIVSAYATVAQLAFQEWKGVTVGKDTITDYLKRINGDPIDEVSEFNFADTVDTNTMYDFAKVGRVKTFFTIPELNMIKPNIKSCSYLSWLYNSGYKQLLEIFTQNPGFVKILSNRIMNKPDFGSSGLENVIIGQNAENFGVMITEGHTGEENVQLALEFRDCRNMLVFHFLTALKNYQKYISQGRMVMEETYRKNAVIDYPFTMYSFVLDETGLFIQYWTRYHGVVLDSVDETAFNPEGLVGALIVKANFKAPMRFSMDPEDLLDFNRISSLSAGGLSASDNTPLSLLPLDLIKSPTERLWTQIEKSAAPWAFWRSGEAGEPEDPLEGLQTLTTAQAYSTLWASVYKRSLIKYHLPYIVKVKRSAAAGYEFASDIYQPALIYL